MRFRTGMLAGTILICVILIGWSVRLLSVGASAARSSVPSPGASDASFNTQRGGKDSEARATSVYAHNLELRKGPDFRIYVPWLRGRLVRTDREVNPSFDYPESFVLDVDSGIIRANMGDLVSYLNASAAGHSPLKNLTLTGDGD